MAILLDEFTEVVVQGATGREGRCRIQMMGLFGEIGTTNEEEAAALIKAGGSTKPVLAYVSGRYARGYASATPASRWSSPWATSAPPPAGFWTLSPDRTLPSIRDCQPVAGMWRSGGAEGRIRSGKEIRLDNS
jgi:hypothetical protein